MPSSGGFALVIALSLMAFVLLLVLSITTLVTVESKSASITLARLEAEQAALLGLQVALGELQKAAGPDQRVTATASIVTAAPNQPHLLGVWKSFTQDNADTTPIDYNAQKSGDFIQWLSSSTAANQTDLTYPQANPVAPAVTLVDSETVSAPVDPNDPSNFISASTIDIDTPNSLGDTGKYAWHIFDESQKVNLTLNQDIPMTDAQRIATLGTAGKPGFQIDATYTELENLSDTERKKILSLNSSSISAYDPVAQSAFHYLTTDSKSLLVDVANGGFQKDLSLLFENSTLPSAYADRHIYSESNTPLVPAPSRFEGGANSAFAEPVPSPDPKWSLLKSHYELYRDVKVVNSSYAIDASSNARFLRGTGYDAVSNPVKQPNPAFFAQQQLLPVVANAQFIFSMAPLYQDYVDSYGDPNYNHYRLWMHFVTDTIVTLWNPYNVNLQFSDMEIEFYRFPLQVKFFRNNVAINVTPAHVGNMFNNLGGANNSNWTGQYKIPYRAKIQASSAGGTITLKPGEYKVFSPADRVSHNNAEHYLKGVTLREGLRIDQGINTQAILFDENKSAIGKERNGAPTGFIMADPGDVISVEVSAAKVDSTGATSGFPETNNKEVAAYLKVYQGDGGNLLGQTFDNAKTQLDQNADRPQVGAIEIDLSNMAALLPSYGRNEMSQLTYGSKFTAAKPNKPTVDWQTIFTDKVPFLIASLRLKTEQDSNSLAGKPNASMWLHNGITNPYFSNGLDQDQDEDAQAHQYELTWEPMTDWNSVPTVELDGQNRGYGGSGITSATGVNFAPFHQIPLTPATSIAQFSHAPLNSGGQAPLTTQIVGNSYSAPLLSLNSKSNSGSLGAQLDHSYMANTTLFDSYFLSTATAQTEAIYGTSRDLNAVITEFFDLTQELPNVNLEPAGSAAPTITAADYDTFAQHLYNKGAFNVNSTSEEAWALFLASGTNEALPILDMLTGNATLTDATASQDSVVSRFAPLIGDEVVATSDGQNRWEGHRRLTAAQIKLLAQNVVAEVKARGPFQSVAEFVNRRLIDDAASGNSGALQAAIENSNLNTDFGLDAPRNSSELGGTGTGNTSDGAATQITQADLLNRLAPSITVRGDTLRIRTYGEVSVGTQTVKAWCEAVVQRGHDFVDASNLSTDAFDDLSDTNKAFGRRFNIVSFRWLSESEI